MPIPFSHLDPSGRARMVDVSRKPVTRRVAEASCRLHLAPETVKRLRRLPKGDALVVAQVAGVQAAKRTDELVPLAHPLPIEQVDVELEPHVDEPDDQGVRWSGVLVRSRVVVDAKTGAEMEALWACAGAALALYDMVKAVERAATISDLRLEAKRGGRSGTYRRARRGTPR